MVIGCRDDLKNHEVITGPNPKYIKNPEPKFNQENKDVRGVSGHYQELLPVLRMPWARKSLGIGFSVMRKLHS